MANKVTKSKAEKALPKSVSDKYSIANMPDVQSLRFNTKKYGTIDFSRVTIAQVEALVKCGCDIFKKKTSKSD